MDPSGSALFYADGRPWQVDTDDGTQALFYEDGSPYAGEEVEVQQEFGSVQADYAAIMEQLKTLTDKVPNQPVKPDHSQVINAMSQWFDIVNQNIAGLQETCSNAASSAAAAASSSAVNSAEPVAEGSSGSLAALIHAVSDVNNKVDLLSDRVERIAIDVTRQGVEGTRSVASSETVVVSSQSTSQSTSQGNDLMSARSDELLIALNTVNQNLGKVYESRGDLPVASSETVVVQQTSQSTTHTNELTAAMSDELLIALNAVNQNLCKVYERLDQLESQPRVGGAEPPAFEPVSYALENNFSTVHTNMAALSEQMVNFEIINSNIASLSQQLKSVAEQEGEHHQIISARINPNDIEVLNSNIAILSEQVTAAGILSEQMHCEVGERLTRLEQNGRQQLFHPATGEPQVDDAAAAKSAQSGHSPDMSELYQGIEILLRANACESNTQSLMNVLNCGCWIQHPKLLQC